MNDKTFVHFAGVVLSVWTWCALASGNEKKPTAQLDTEFKKDVSREVGSFVPCQTLFGKSVFNETGTKIGRLDDIIIDPFVGMASTLVVTPSPQIGRGYRMLIPFNLVTPIRQLTLRVRVDVEKLRGGPSIAGNQDVKPYRRQFAMVPFGYYGIDAIWESAPLVRSQKLDDEDVFVYMKTLQGSPVRDKAGQKIGEIDDAVVSLDNGKIAYVALQVRRESDSDRTDRYAIPLAAFVARANKENWILELERDSLRAMDSIPRHRKWPAKVESGWRTYVKARYGDGMFSGVQRQLSSENNTEKE